MKIDGILISIQLDQPGRYTIDLEDDFNLHTMVDSICENAVGDASLSNRVRKDNPDLVKEVKESVKRIRAYMKQIKATMTPIVRKLDKAALVAEKAMDAEAD